MISTGWALETTLRLVAFSLLIQSIEILSIRKSWVEQGPWAWKNLRDEFRIFGTPLFECLDRLLSARGYLLVLLLQFAGSLGCLAYPDLRWAPVFFVTVFLGCMRWRGTFNGGSDYMTILVLMALSVASFVRTERAAEFALAYIGIQVIASYFIAGLVKVKESEWRSGRALQVFLTTTGEGAPSCMGWMSRSRLICATASWLVILSELAAPLLLVASRRPEWQVGALTLAFSFHVANAVIFGLNRFVWAWLAGYCGVAVVGRF